MPPAKRKKGEEEEKKISSRVWPKNVLDIRDAEQLNRKFPGYTFRVPTANENPGTWIDEELCLFVEFFKDGQLLPLPEFLVGFCSQFRMVPAMLMPNTLIVLRSLFVFYGTWEIPWSQESILSLITFTLKEPGSYYAQPKHPGEFKMLGIPSSRHGWKERYLFVKSDKGWPIKTTPEIPHKDAFKGWGITKKLSRMLKAYGTLPFCLNMETLEIMPAKEEEQKKATGTAAKKKTGEVCAPVTKKARTRADSEKEASSGDSDDEEEGSVQWSAEINTAAAAIRKVVQKVRKPPGITIREPTAAAPVVEEPTSAKGKEKVEEAGITDSTSSGAVGATAGPTDEKEATKAEQPEGSGTEGEWEWHYSEELKIFSMKRNNRYKFIPRMELAPLPLLLPGLLKHPEDERQLNEMSDHEVGTMQAHLSFTNMILGQCLTERLMMTSQELSDCKADVVDLQKIVTLQKELTNRYKLESESLGSIVQSQDADHKEVVAAFEAKETTATEELSKAKAEVERLQQLHKQAEEKLQAENAAVTAERDALKAKVAELERNMAKEPKSQAVDDRAKQELIEEYKESDEYQYELKDVGLYGFNLLKRVLKKENKLSSAELNLYDYDSCLAEDADENIPL